MAITLNQVPYGPIFSDDPTLVDIIGDPVSHQITPTSAVIFNVSNLPVVGELFTLSVPDLFINMVFTAKIGAQTADDTTEIYYGSGYASVTDYIDDEVLPVLSRNPILKRFFQITRSDVNKFKLDVRDSDTMPDFSVSLNAAQASWSLTLEALNSKDVFKTNYQVVLELWENQKVAFGLGFSAPDWNRVQAVSKSVNDSHRVKFDIGRLLRDWDLDVTIPNGELFVLKNQCRNYFAIVAYDVYQNSLFPDQVVYGPQKEAHFIFAFKGGTPKWMSPEIDLANRWNGAVSKRTWLTWFDFKRRVRVDQEHYLYFVITSLTEVDAYLCIEAKFTDGTIKRVIAMSDELASPKISANFYDVVQVNVSVSKFANTLNSSKEIESYEAWIVGANNVDSALIYTPKMPFKIDRRKRKSERNFMYKGSFGVFEFIRFDGDSFEGVTVKSQEAQKVLAADYNVWDFEVFTNRISAQKYLTASTGFLNKDELSQFVDFMCSKEIYLKTESGWLPVQPEKREVTLLAGKEHFKGVTMKFLIDSEQMRIL